METSRTLYLDLLKRCLMNFIYGDKEVIPADPKDPLKRMVVNVLKKGGLQVVRSKEFLPEVRAEGRDWPLYGQTMLSEKRLNNIQECVESVLSHNVPGDLIETGVWRGGASILMRAILKAYDVTDRKVWVADSFAGLPPPDAAKYPQDAAIHYETMTELMVSLEEVKGNFARYGLLDNQVEFLKGWFKDTLPKAPLTKIAVMRLDGDMYESTMDSLSSLYPKLSVGGFVIIDDYVLPACRQAVHDYLDQNHIQAQIIEVDWAGVYWQREA